MKIMDDNLGSTVSIKLLFETVRCYKETRILLILTS
jgi:hypothetical protein